MISTTSIYAFKALTVLAGSSRPGFMTVGVLARRANVPSPYLSKLIKILASEGIVITKKGIKGGVKLASRPITFYDICVALQEPALLSEDIFLEPEREFDYPSQFERVWRKFRGDLLSSLKETSLMVAAAPNRNEATADPSFPRREIKAA